MKSDTPTTTIGVIILVAIALGVVLVADYSAAKTEVRGTRFEFKQLGQDASVGVKNVFDLTQDAAHDAKPMAKDAVK